MNTLQIFAISLFIVTVFYFAFVLWYVKDPKERGWWGACYAFTLGLFIVVGLSVKKIMQPPEAPEQVRDYPIECYYNIYDPKCDTEDFCAGNPSEASCIRWCEGEGQNTTACTSSDCLERINNANNVSSDYDQLVLYDGIAADPKCATVCRDCASRDSATCVTYYCHISQPDDLCLCDLVNDTKCKAVEYDGLSRSYDPICSKQCCTTPSTTVPASCDELATNDTVCQRFYCSHTNNNDPECACYIDPASQECSDYCATTNIFESSVCRERYCLDAEPYDPLCQGTCATASLPACTATNYFEKPLLVFSVYRQEMRFSTMVMCYTNTELPQNLLMCELAELFFFQPVDESSLNGYILTGPSKTLGLTLGPYQEVLVSNDPDNWLLFNLEHYLRQGTFLIKTARNLPVYNGRPVPLYLTPSTLDEGLEQYRITLQPRTSDNTQEWFLYIDDSSQI